GPVSAQEREALVRLVWDDETTYAEAADLADKIIAAGWRPAPAAEEVEAATEPHPQQDSEVREAFEAAQRGHGVEDIERAAYVREHLADYLRDWRMAPCDHTIGMDREPCCSPCLRDR